MLDRDMKSIGDRLFSIRKKTGLTQSELATKASVSDRTYADIERGNTDLRVSTLLSICSALSITPNEILVCEKTPLDIKQNELFDSLNLLSEGDKGAVLKLIDVFINYIRDCK